MGRKHSIRGHYVRVEADNWLHPERMDKERDLCCVIAKEIHRHVDGIRTISVETEAEYLCEFCGAVWTEGDSPHNGGCCDEDVAVMEGVDTDSEKE